MAALDIIDEQGLEKFSLAMVAKKLGVRTPSLYYHFRDRSELLQEVARLMLIRLPGLRLAGRSYEERIIDLCVSTRRALLQHHNAAPLILQYFPKHILLAAYDKHARETPFPPEMQIALIEAIEKLTYGTALFQAAALARGVDAMPPVDPARYPALAKAIAQNPFDDEGTFVESLRIFLLGARMRAAGHDLDEFVGTRPREDSGESVAENG